MNEAILHVTVYSGRRGHTGVTVVRRPAGPPSLLGLHSHSRPCWLWVDWRCCTAGGQRLALAHLGWKVTAAFLSGEKPYRNRWTLLPERGGSVRQWVHPESTEASSLLILSWTVSRDRGSHSPHICRSVMWAKKGEKESPHEAALCQACSQASPSWLEIPNMSFPWRLQSRASSSPQTGSQLTILHTNVFQHSFKGQHVCVSRWFPVWFSAIKLFPFIIWGSFYLPSLIILPDVSLWLSSRNLKEPWTSVAPKRAG